MLTILGLKEGIGHSLYSFRHGFAEALRHARYLGEQFGSLLGHTGATMTGCYGQMPQGMLEERVKLINAVAYLGLDLDHLHHAERPGPSCEKAPRSAAERRQPRMLPVQLKRPSGSPAGSSDACLASHGR